jgi:hypothetical protein
MRYRNGAGAERKIDVAPPRAIHICGLRGKWLDPHCSILISLARARGRAARERLPEYAQNAHGSGSSWRFARRSHQRRLEQGRGGERAEQRQRQELAHAGGAGMGGEPEAAERRCRHQRAEQHGARQRRLQKICFAAAPRCHVIDLESDADPEQHGQRDDVGIVQGKSGQRADLERDGARDQEGNEREQDVADAAQNQEQQDGDRAERP